MSDENKNPMVDQKKGADEKTQLSEEALKEVSGGNPSETVSFTYGDIKVEYEPQKPDGTL